MSTVCDGEDGSAAVPVPDNATEVVVDPARIEIFPETLPFAVGSKTISTESD